MLELNIKNVKKDKKCFLFLKKTLFNILNNMGLDLEQKKSMNSDSSFIRKKILKSIKLMQAKILSELVTTCSLQWRNLKQINTTDCKFKHLIKNKSQLILMIHTSLIQQTGEKKELLMLLETKEHVDHAGLLQQLQQLKEHTSSSMENL